MKKAIWTQDYDVNTLLVTPQKRLGLYGLLNLVQDTAWVHATHLGHGYEAMVAEKTAWVLTRQRLTMDRWPRWGEKITLKTWIRPKTNLFAVRDFEFSQNDELIGRCTTQWLILDLETRRPSTKGLNFAADEFRQDSPEFFDAKKISTADDLKELAEFHVRNSDLDLNGHVNNTKYAQWILDSISYEKHLLFTLRDYEVNFLSETKAGDKIRIFGGRLGDDRFQFRGVLSADAKVAFVATVKVSAEHSPPSSNIS